MDPAARLGIGDHLQSTDGSQVRIVALRDYTTRMVTYNLTIDNLHTYYVVAGSAPVLVHNSSGCGGDGWSSTENLNQHFDRHGAEMGFDTKSEYDYAAQDLMCGCDGYRPGIQIKVDGSTRYYFDPRLVSLA